MSDKELEQKLRISRRAERGENTEEFARKLRWIFETYGKDLQAFFRDAYAEGLNVRPALPKYTQYCSKCGEGHNKAVAYCLKPDCGGMMGERRHALRAALKLETLMFKGAPLQFDNLTGLKSEGDNMTFDLFNTNSHEQMRCGFFHREDERFGFIGVESMLNGHLRGFYTFADIQQVKELRMFLENVEKEWEAKLTSSESCETIQNVQ